jgi:hypothetical protein
VDDQAIELLLIVFFVVMCLIRFGILPYDD